jgi:hypothetical protein
MNGSHDHCPRLPLLLCSSPSYVSPPFRCWMSIAADRLQQYFFVTLLDVLHPQTASPLLARSRPEKAAVIAVHLACSCASCARVHSIALLHELLRACPLSWHASSARV